MSKGHSLSLFETSHSTFARVRKPVKTEVKKGIMKFEVVAS